MNEKKKHILVTGTHRSGTTWVGRTISQARKIELVYEPFNMDFTRYNFDYKFDNWFEHVPTSQKYKEIKKEFDRYIPNSFIQQPLKICRESGLSPKTPLIFIKHLMLSYDRPRYLLKDPIALLSAGWLYERYNLKVICMIRNPFAFTGSLKKQGWDFDFNNFLRQEKLMKTWLAPFQDDVEKVQKDGDFIDRISLLWTILNSVIVDYQKKYPEWFFIKHEELALDPITNYQKMFDYLSLDFTDEIEEYIRTFTSEENPTEAKSNRFQPRNAEETIESWKNRLTEEEIERIRTSTQAVCDQLYPEGNF